MNTNKPFYKRWVFLKCAGIAFLALILVGIVGGYALELTGYTEKAEQERITRENKAWSELTEKVKADKPAEIKSEPARSDEETIANAAREAFGAESVKSVTYVDGINVAMIAIDEPIALSADSSRKQFLLAVRKTIQDIADMPGLVGVDVRWKDGDMRLVELRFEGDAIARAAKATHVDDLATIAGEYWAHSGF